MSDYFPTLPEPVRKRLHKKISELRGKSYLPEAMVNVVTELIQLQLRAEALVRWSGSDTLPPKTKVCYSSADAHLQGAPVLARRDFPVDMDLAGRLIPEILRIIMEQAPELSPLACEVEKAFASGVYDLPRAVQEILAEASSDADHTPLKSEAEPLLTTTQGGESYTGNHETSFSRWEKAHPEAPGFLRFVVQSAVMPSLAMVARQTAAKHNSETVWEHGHCPICGSQPLMGRIADAESGRFHSCSFCGFEYRAPRIGCPFCLAVSHEGSEYYVAEDEPGYELDVCNQCKNYFKIADFRKLDRIWMPLLDDLASLTLDLYARQMGYSRPTLSAWGF